MLEHRSKYASSWASTSHLCVWIDASAPHKRPVSSNHSTITIAIAIDREPYPTVPATSQATTLPRQIGQVWWCGMCADHHREIVDPDAHFKHPSPKHELSNVEAAGAQTGGFNARPWARITTLGSLTRV